MTRTFVCENCGAEYRGHAEYCNACGETRFRVEGDDVRSAPRALRSDQTILAVQGLVWLAGLVVFANTRGFRDPTEVVWAWVFTALFGVAVGIVTHHARAAAAFAALAGVLYGLALGVLLL